MGTNSKNTLQRFSDEELASKKKALMSLLIILLVLEALYLGYYAYLGVSGNFDPDRHLLGLVPLLALAPIMVLNIVNYGRLTSEQQRRRGA